jgi:hypothetical protein
VLPAAAFWRLRQLKQGRGRIPVAASRRAVDETLCITCHSSSVENLTGDAIVAKYMSSVHNLNTVGCQDCHGGGSLHNGVGPIPYPSPNHVQCQTCHNSENLVTNYAASNHYSVLIENEEGEPCQRCHTHQGAVLAAKFGFTGDKDVMAAMVNAPGLIDSPEPIKCNTCHETHNTKVLRVDAGWTPSDTSALPTRARTVSTVSARNATPISIRMERWSPRPR